MTHHVSPVEIVGIHEATAHLPAFEQFTEQIRMLYALPRPYFTDLTITAAQARSLAFATRPPDLDVNWELLWAIPNRAIEACKAANEVRPLGWLHLLCEIALWARVDCIDTTEWIDERHDRPRVAHFRTGKWVDHRVFRGEANRRQ